PIGLCQNGFYLVKRESRGDKKGAEKFHLCWWMHDPHNEFAPLHGSQRSVPLSPVKIAACLDWEAKYAHGEPHHDLWRHQPDLHYGQRCRAMATFAAALSLGLRALGKRDRTPGGDGG